MVCNSCNENKSNIKSKFKGNKLKTQCNECWLIDEPEKEIESIFSVMGDKTGGKWG